MEINFSDLFFTCSLIELIGRITHQKRAAIVSLLGRKIVTHIYEHADVLHCEPIAKTADTFIEICNIPNGDFDNVAACAVDHSFVSKSSFLSADEIPVRKSLYCLSR